MPLLSTCTRPHPHPPHCLTRLHLDPLTALQGPTRTTPWPRVDSSHSTKPTLATPFPLPMGLRDTHRGSSLTQGSPCHGLICLSPTVTHHSRKCTATPTSRVATLRRRTRTRAVTLQVAEMGPPSQPPLPRMETAFTQAATAPLCPPSTPPMVSLTRTRRHTQWELPRPCLPRPCTQRPVILLPPVRYSHSSPTGPSAGPTRGEPEQ